MASFTVSTLKGICPFFDPLFRYARDCKAILLPKLKEIIELEIDGRDIRLASSAMSVDARGRIVPQTN